MPAQLDLAAPLVIGGTGGSGTRVVKRIVDATGRFLGAHLNDSDDALDFAKFDWRWGPQWLEQGPSEEMRSAFERTLECHLAPAPDAATSWGWKHPHSYILLPFLAKRFAQLRFVHVVRDGRDMALSPNQNQYRLYGATLLGDAFTQEPTTSASLAFWGTANLRASQYGEAHLGERYACIRFEDVCREPAAAARRLLAFASGRADEDSVAAAAAQVRPPDSIGRGASISYRSAVTPAAQLALEAFGYVEPRT